MRAMLAKLFGKLLRTRCVFRTGRFRADRPIHNFAKFQSAIAFEQKFITAHFQPIEDTS
jgi:hypothetical protein